MSVSSLLGCYCLSKVVIDKAASKMNIDLEATHEINTTSDSLLYLFDHEATPIAFSFFFIS